MWCGLIAVSSLAWFSASVARQLLYPVRLPVPPDAPWPAHVTHELTASDGRRFDAWLLEAPRPQGRIVLCHGYSADRRQVIGLADGLRQAGFEVVLIEMRGHGSRPGPCTLGLRETEDVQQALDWARGRGGAPATPTGAIGWSMGAVIACQLARRDASVRAVVLDSPYACLLPVLRRAFAQRYRWLPGTLMWPTWLILQAWLRAPLWRLDPIGLAPGLGQPLLVIEGGQDRRVAPGMSQALYTRWAGPKQRWHDPAVGHVGMFAAHPQEYCRRVAAHLQQAFA